MKLTGNELINAIAFKVDKCNLVLGSSDMNMSVNRYINQCPPMGKRQIMNSDWTYVRSIDSGRGGRGIGNTLMLYTTPIRGGVNSIVLINN